MGMLRWAVIVKLSGPENFLSRLAAVWAVVNKLPTGFDKIRIANAIKDTLDDEDDKVSTRYITNLSEIIRYIQAKYITGVNIVDTPLDPIKKLKTPDSKEQCMSAIEIVLSLLEQVINAGFEVWLSIMKDKVVRPGKMYEYMEGLR